MASVRLEKVPPGSGAPAEVKRCFIGNQQEERRCHKDIVASLKAADSSPAVA